MRALVACVALGLLVTAWGCGGRAPESATNVDWDLSTSHTMADVAWPEPDLDAVDLDPVDSVRIRFSDDREIDEPDGIGRVGVFRTGEQVTDVSIFSDSLTVDDAHRLALRWCRRWKLPTTSIDAWHAAGGETFNVTAYDPKEKLGANRPSISVKLLYSFDDDRTTIVSLRFFWGTQSSADASK